MKSLFLTGTIIACSIFFSCKESNSSYKQKLAKEIKSSDFKFLWETDPVFKTPESCLYDEKHKVVYISNVNDAPRTKDNNGFISKINSKGEILKYKWATGLSAPKGMAYADDVLYVTDIDAVVEIDAHSGKIIMRNVLEGALMLNDIAIDSLGTLYVSAMDTNKIYTLNDGEFNLWKDNLNKPNGLLVDEGSLLVASLGNGTFKSYDIKTKEEKKYISSNLGKADGIVKLRSGGFLVSDWRGEIFHITDEKSMSIYNAVENKDVQTADIGIIPNENMVLVPTFFGNTIRAYEFSK